MPAAPNTLWGTDLTTTLTTAEGQVAVFVAIDHYTAEFVGVHAAGALTQANSLYFPCSAGKSWLSRVRS